MPRNKRLTSDDVMKSMRDGDTILSELTVEIQRIREKFDILDDGYPYLSSNRLLREHMFGIDMLLSELADSLSDLRTTLPIRGMNTINRLNKKS